jgi:hypothetical protein
MLRRLGITLLALALLVSPALAAITIELAVGTATAVLTTELNNLNNNVWTAASAVYDNRIGQTGNGYTICRLELFAVFGANPSAGGAITGWFLKTVDGGTNYEVTPTSSFAQQRLPDFVIPVVTGQTTTRTSIDVRCPAERFKIAVQNTATNQAMAATNNTLKILPITLQGN